MQVVQVDGLLRRTDQCQAGGAAVGDVAGSGIGDPVVDADPQLRHPHVPDVGLEICVAPQRHSGMVPLVATIAAPVGPPGVLHQETVTGVADNGEGVPAADIQGIRLPVDHAAPRRAPAVVGPGRGEEHTDIAQRRLHVIDPREDPEIGTQGNIQSLLLDLRGQRDLAPQWPAALQADPMLVPALHGATGAAEVVVLTGPLVVAAGHGEKHRRADLAGQSAPAAQVVDGRRQAEAGAGAFLTLVEDVQQLPVRVELIRQRRQGGGIGEVAEVHGITANIQPLGTGLPARFGWGGAPGHADLPVRVGAT
ncbi:hypothetical protein D9M70_465480 [compost metagenome]